jgi:alpha-glucosidase
MEMAPPASTNNDTYAHFPDGYQALGTTQSIEKDAARVRLYTDSATVEVTALAPDLFRVGLFPDGHPVCYDSVAVIAQEWEPGTCTLVEEDGALTLATSQATVHLALDPLRIGFTDRAGRAFATDDPALGMGWFSSTLEGDLVNLDAPVRVYKQHPAGEHYYGCGERTGGLDKTESHQIFWNIDPPPGHTGFQNNLYVSIPCTLALANGHAWGFFLDNTAQVEFDLALESPQRSWFGAASGDLIYYVFCGPTPQQVLARYADLTGRTPLPPLWALGNGQSRFSYETAAEVLRIARTFRERDIPCDTLYLDIDTLDGYRVFTWDRTRFPDPEVLLTELREMGFHVVSIVDAGIKVDEHFTVYTQGRDHHFYCKSPQGDDYQGEVWPGACVFPDFTNPDARTWWGEQQRPLLDAGIAGIWSDMNEPALFIPPNSTLPANVVHQGGGRIRLHHQVHNAYGSLMVQAEREGLLRLRPEQRPFIISRSGYAGVQRHALIWTGDNCATWEHLAMSMAQLQNLGLSGVGWCGVDVGGFYEDTTGELLTRWTELGIFQAFCRNHSEKRSRHQEPWVFGEPYETHCRAMLKLRQRLLPYLYTLFDECNRTGAPLLRPLFWVYPEDMSTYAVDDEMLCGAALLLAPITRPGIEHRHVYLPAGTWFHFWTGARTDGPVHSVAHAPLGQPALYVRANTAVPLWPATNYVDPKQADPLTLLLFPVEGYGQAWLYEDAGEGYEHLNGVYARRTITCEAEPGLIHVLISAQEGTFMPVRQHIRLEMREISAAPENVRLGETEAIWHYYPDQRFIAIDLEQTSAALDLIIQC